MSGAARRSRGLTLTVAAIWTTMLVAGATERVHGAPSPAETRLRTVVYRPDAVLTLTAFVGYHIHLEFAPDERFITLAAGDTASLDVGSEGNHLLLKPKQATAGTNLTLLTTRRTYFVDYRALARAPRPEEAVYSVKFQYPDEAVATRAFGEARALDTQVDALPPPVNSDYWYCGSAALRPTAADDDGIQVRLKFAPNVELPTIYAAAPDGAEMLVNSHVENDTIIVHRLAQRFVLRRGLLVGCVLNRSMQARGRRAASGTLHGAVGRTTRELDR
jgi:type IV secretion system protein VirB9